MPVQVIKMVYVSPMEIIPPVYGVDAGISSPFQSGLPGMTLSCTAWVTNTGNVQDTYILTASDNAIPSWNPTGFPPSITVAAGMTWIGSVDVTIPLNTPSGAIDNITFTATGTGVSDSDSCIAQVTTYFIKYCMPDLGQHSVNWCWAAAAANSLYWYSQHGYPQLIDDPADPTPNDNRYITDPLIIHPPPPIGDGVYRLLHEIATDVLFPGAPENMITIDNTYCHPSDDIMYFFGLQEFIDEQGAPLIVHEIVNENLVFPSPPPIENRIVYGQPTLEDYQRELGRCQDVLLWLNYRHTEGYYPEETDHVVTGVGFSYDNQWLIVSDPWTPGAPDHSNDLTHTLTPYDDLQVISAENEPLWVLYNGMPVQVSKMMFISPENVPTTPCTGTASIWPATGSPPAAPFLCGIRKAKTTENLVVNTGDNLRLRFLAQDNVTVENEAVIWSRTAPGAQTVNLTNLIVPHDNNLPYPLFNVKRVKLVLTDSAGTVILDNMAWYRAVQDDWGNRITWIILNWASHNSSQQDQLGNEISQIILNWASTPTVRDQHDFSQS